MKPNEQPKESPGWAANPKYLIDWDLVPATVSVLVNGEVCTMRGKKLRPGDVVEALGRRCGVQYAD